VTVAATLQDRVRSLIEESGLKQEAFAVAVGLDASKLSKSLNEHRRFSSLDLAMIAQYSGVTVDWLIQGVGQHAVAARVAHDGSSVGDAIREAESLVEARDNLLFLGASQHWPEPPPFQSPLWTEQGKELADFALSHLGHPDTHENESFATAIEQNFGIDVRVMHLGPGCDGLAMCGSGARVLLVASTENPTRQRFTMAHELAHLLCKDSQDVHVDENVMARSGPRDSSEMRANSFAAHLLMPESMLCARFSGPMVSDDLFANTVMDLMVSPSSLAWRLLNLKQISAERRAQLGRLRTIDCAAMTGRMKDYATWVEASNQPRIPLRLLQDSFQAYLDGRTTLRPVARLFDIPVELLRRAVEQPASATEESGADFEP
jgi:transcriptional regulator with XRE-family HTH domain